MNWTVGAYITYLLIAIPITIWVARTLSHNGKVFLADVFKGEAGLVEAVNTLLVVGFYLLNLGFVMLFLRAGGEVHDLTGLFEQLSVKIGTVMLLLGVVHFTNILVFSSIRRSGRRDAMRFQPPMAPLPYPTHHQQ